MRAAAASTGSVVVAMAGHGGVIHRSAAIVSANGRGSASGPRGHGRRAICGSASSSNGHSQNGSTIAQITAATMNPMNSVVTGCDARRPASSP